MSFSMQISRGALALTLLVLFVLLAVVARPHGQERAGAMPVTAALVVCEVPAPRASAWRLAQTPADLGPLARRWDSCRA